MNILKTTILIILISINVNLFAKDLVDDDPRRTVVFQQPRLEVISAILQKHYDKGSAEDLYKIYKTNPAAFDQIKVEFTDTTNTYKFRNPNGVDSPPTEVRVWVRYNKDGSDWSFDSLFGLTKTFAGREISGLTDIVNKLPAYNPSLQTSGQSSIQEKIPSSIQLKAMQTRKFNKSPWEIKKAIEEHFKDTNGNCGISGPSFSPIGLKGEMVKGKTIMSVEKYATTPGQGTCYWPKNLALQFEFEVTAPAPQAKGSETLQYDQGLAYGTPSTYKINSCTVRLRIKNVTQQTQIYDPQAYQKVFKEIADQAFIEAIEIDPAQIE